jgi:putative hydrolase of the HAD superfamily
MTRPADALLFDLGGVVMALDWGPMFESWAGDSGASAAELRRRLKLDEPYERHERGEIDDAQYFDALRHSLGIDITDEQWTRGWNAMFAGEIRETVALIARVKDRVPVYAFSNTNFTHERVWSRLYAEAMKNFRIVFTSSTLGMRKPESRAFEHISREIGVPLERILFFDDTAANVEGAKVVGMQAVLVRSPRDVESALGPWLG